MSVTITRSSWAVLLGNPQCIFFMSFLLGWPDFSEKTHAVFCQKIYLTAFWEPNGRRDLVFSVSFIYIYIYISLSLYLSLYICICLFFFLLNPSNFVKVPWQLCLVWHLTQKCFAPLFPKSAYLVFVEVREELLSDGGLDALPVPFPLCLPLELICAINFYAFLRDYKL